MYSSPALCDDAEWAVPSHDVALYRGKQHRYALVIPVINEGERIQRQLLRVRDADLPVDVVVADGGSTDGSLSPDFVKPAGVRAVLTKTGPGKLSAQLRVAYSWCLREGYDGIITIDGNGKDGVEAISDMAQKLDEGCDYVQGSRYLPGGLAENTPLERTIANRFIHAPLLSVAARRFFSDTTNGFRAYSARYLTHPDVRPFRDEFQVYGLLFYLTVRAGQLGLKVDQVPVKRSYPDSGKVPTKIGGFRSKLALLGETVYAATGGNTPDSASATPSPMLWQGLAALVILLPLFMSVLVSPPYSPDSWALYELSKTIFGDFYRFSHFRSYAHMSAYSSAFPPLTPALIAVFDGVFNTGARTGLYLAFAAFFVFAMLSEQIGRRVTGAAWVGLSASLLLLLGHKMVLIEMSAGRTIPLQLCFYALIVLGLIDRERITLVRASGLGFIAGLAVLNRFDAVFLPFLLAGLLAALTRSPARAGIALASSAVAISPWIAYSLATFAVPFATDNSAIATTLDPRAFVTDWWPTAQPSLSDNPLAWFTRVAGNVPTGLIAAASLMISLMGLVFVLTFGPVLGLQFIASYRPDGAPRRIVAPQQIRALLGFAGVLGALMVPQLLTGYLDYRYFSGIFWMAFLLLGLLVVAQGRTVHQRRTFGWLIFAVVGASTLAFSLTQLALASNRSALAFEDWVRFERDEEIAALQTCLKEDPGARILVLGDATLAAKGGALAGLRTMMEPRNMTEGRLEPDGSRAFVETWGVEYIYVREAEREAWARQVLNLQKSQPCELALFRITD